MTHTLKTWPEFFKKVKDGSKPWELRKYDRLYSQGDKVILQEWNPEVEKYTGDELEFHIGYVYFGNEFGLRKGWCIFTLVGI